MPPSTLCERIRVVKNGNTIGITGQVIPTVFILLSTLSSLRDRDRDRDRDREEVV